MFSVLFLVIFSVLSDAFTKNTDAAQTTLLEASYDCTYQHGRLSGDRIRGQDANDVEECCEVCYTHHSCIGWTFQRSEGYCILRSSTEDVRPDDENDWRYGYVFSSNPASDSSSEVRALPGDIICVPPFTVDPVEGEYSLPSSIDPAICGIGGLITNGNTVYPEDKYPWMVYLYGNVGHDEFFCGATLIHERWVLTAAHCAVYDPERYLLLLGIHNKDDMRSSIVRNVIHIEIHPQHDQYDLNNDVALMKLDEPVYDLDPIELASGSHSRTGTAVWAVGWGRDENGGYPAMLQEAEINVMHGDETGYGSMLTGDMLVAGATDSSGRVRSACFGDSGGPLIYDDQNPVLVGITSFGPSTCTLAQYPTVFQDLSHSSNQEFIYHVLSFSGSSPQTVVIAAADGLCERIDETRITGERIRSKGKYSWVECCNWCLDERGCIAWSFHELGALEGEKGDCILRSADLTTLGVDGWVSGLLADI